MLRKTLSLCLLGFLAFAGAASSRAQIALTDRADGSLTVLGGWDFNSVGVTTSASSLVARYNQQYAPYFGSTLNANGNAALSTTLFFTSNGGTFSGARNFNAANAPVYDLLSSDGLTVSNNSLGDITTGNTRSILLSNTTTLDNARAVISLDTLTTFDRFENINVAYSARNQGAADATISWSYSIDGGFTFVPITGTTATIASNSASFDVYTASFSGIAAIEGRSDVLIGLNYSESAAAASVFLDNLAIYGTAAPLAVPPSVTNLADQLAILGDDVTFAPTITGAGTSPTYRWETSPYDLQTWVTVPSAAGPTLVLTDVGAAAFAQYRLVVTNPLNNTSVTSAAARLLLAAAPAIAPEDQPQGKTINPGQTAIFAVIASGTDPLEYRWFKDDVLLADDDRISGSTTAVLTIVNAEVGDSGDYFVEVSNEFGEVPSAVAALLVDAGDVAPSIIVQPAPVTANSGGDATFVVVAGGTPEPTFRWRKGSDFLSDGPGISGSATATLSLTGITEASAGQYSVVVENIAGTTPSNAVALNVLFAPRIATGGQPQPVSVNIGETAVFTVVAEGNPAPTYQWRKGTQALDGQTSATLTLANVTLDTAGNYNVVVTNTRGNVTSANAALTVRSAPVISSEPQSTSGFVGGSATLRVTASGVPAVGYQWFRGDEAVPGATSATLTLSPLTAAQAGDYTVRVTNTGGSVTSSVATVTVGYDVVRLPGGATQTFLPGAPLRFRTGVTGTDLTYQWYRNGRAIPGATAVTYSVEAVSVADAGVYSFRAFAPNGRALINHTVGRVNVSPAGSFRFLLRDEETGEPLGRAVITVAGNLRITGTLLYDDGKTYSLRGALTEEGLAASGTLTVARKALPSLTLALEYDYARVEMAGVLSVVGVEDSEIAGSSFAFTRAPAWKGKYTLALAPVSEGEPSATASLPVTIGSTGTASIAGRLADGARFTASIQGDIAGNFPFYSRPYGKSPGVVAGDLTVVLEGGAYSATPESSGNWFWHRPAAGARAEIDLILAPTLTPR